MHWRRRRSMMEATAKTLRSSSSLFLFTIQAQVSSGHLRPVFMRVCFAPCTQRLLGNHSVLRRGAEEIVPSVHQRDGQSARRRARKAQNDHCEEWFWHRQVQSGSVRMCPAPRQLLLQPFTFSHYLISGCRPLTPATTSCCFQNIPPKQNCEKDSWRPSPTLKGLEWCDGRLPSPATQPA